jgi:arylsulfatase A-like enzyme
MTRLRGDGWLPLSVGGAAGVTIVEAALIERRFGLFRGGFLAPEHLENTTQRLAFLLISGLSDLVVIALLAGITLWLANRWGLATVPRRFLALVIGISPLVLADLFSYQLLSYLGDAFDLSLMWDLVGRQPREFFAVGAAHLAQPLWLISSATAVVAVCVWVLQRRFPADLLAARARGPAAWALMLVVLAGSVGVTAAASFSEPMELGLRRKPSAQAIAIVVNVLTDLDRDGYGVGHRPPDPDQFNASIYPYAVEVPGNGVDEDGIGGDLPVESAKYVEGLSKPPAWTWRPDVVLVLLESVRADSLDAVVNGKPATPVMNAIAQAGGSAQRAYSHNGFTYQSRFHLFSGSIPGIRGTTLVDDFEANGYRVGYFSGQDDSFGGPELGVGFQRADVFFDARSAPERRYTQFSTPGSLALPASVVLEQVARFLGSTDRSRPMFVYVNFHDTHFPYHYAAIQPLLTSVVLDPGSIVPSRGAELRDMYMNTVANVDQAIGQLVAEVTRVRGHAPAVIVTSDHGESLFDEGFLGHGYALNEAQTRVPFVAEGLPLALPQPFGHADVRRAIWNALARTPESAPRPDFSQVSTSPVFQYLGSVDRPREIGALDGSGRLAYDFRSDRVQAPGRTDWQRRDSLSETDAASFLTLVRRWEAMMVARARGPVPGSE